MKTATKLSPITTIGDEDFSDRVERADLPAVVLFRGVWSGPSRATRFALDEVAHDFSGKVAFFEIDMMDNWIAANRYGVRTAPTVTFFWKGRELTRREGIASADEMRAMVSRMLDTISQAQSREPLRIVAGLDDDAARDAILATLARRVRTGKGDEVVLVHALPVFPWMRGTSHRGGWAGVVRSSHEKAERFLSVTASQLSKTSAFVRTSPVEGNPAEEILSAARELPANLIVVGALAPRERDLPMVGSVSEKVASLAEADVLIVRGCRAEDEYRVLIAVDGSAESLAAVESFAEKFHAERADVEVLYVLETPKGLGDETEVSALLEKEATLGLARAREILAARAIPSSVELRRGKPAVEILDVAGRRGADLVVLGARGLARFSGLAWGSVAERVAQGARASVLVARGGRR